VLTLKRGAELSQSSVNGIKGVVANAVPGLRTNKVSIADDEGRLLSQSVESGEAARAEMETGIREQIEKEMAGKVIAILEPLVGKGNVQANAAINLDFNTTEQTEETFNPNPPVILSQQKSEERAGAQGGASGVPGTQSNVGASPVQASTSGTERFRQSEVTNYEVSKLVRHTIQPKGNVRRLSVAVILDHKTVYGQTKDGKVTTRLEPRSPKDIESYRQLVQAAVGFDSQRGDVVTIENVPFFTDTKPEEPQPVTPWYIKRQTYLLPAMKYGSFIVLFFLVYFIIFRPIRKKAFQAMSYAALGPGGHTETLLVGSESESDALPSGATPQEIAASNAATAAASLTAGESAAQDDTLMLETASDEQIERELIREASQVDMGGRKYAAIKKKLVDKARKDPEMISQLIRTMLRERA
jgi:flagellar M-ring protein FliF